MSAFFSAAALVFVAELGDKSQLMALAFASRLGARPVLIAVAVGSVLLHGVAVAVGAAAGAALPTRGVTVVAGLLFLGFAAWTLRTVDGDDEEEDVEVGRQVGGAAVLAAGAAFVLAELGDKTQLTSVALAATNPWLPTWLGASVGMIAVDAVAVLVGHRLGQRLPERTVRLASAIAFLVFGLVLLVDALRG